MAVKSAKKTDRPSSTKKVTRKNATKKVNIQTAAKSSKKSSAHSAAAKSNESSVHSAAAKSNESSVESKAPKSKKSSEKSATTRLRKTISNSESPVGKTPSKVSKVIQPSVANETRKNDWVDDTDDSNDLASELKQWADQVTDEELLLGSDSEVRAGAVLDDIESDAPFRPTDNRKPGLLTTRSLSSSSGRGDSSQRIRTASEPSGSAVVTTQPKKVAVEIVEDEPSSDKKGETKEYSHLPAQVTDGLTLYLNEIRKYPLLSREDELALAKRYFEFHDPKDAEKLVTANLRFVVKVAAEYAKFGSRLVDLIQEGNVGLMHAVKEFNPYKGVRLITYAVWWIRGYIQEYLMRQYSMVRIGTTQNQRKLFYRLEKERERMIHDGQQVTPKLLSDRLGVTEEEVNDMQQRLSGRDLSLDQPLDSESSARWVDFEHSDEESDLTDQLAQQQALKLLQSAIGDLRAELNAKEIKLLDERLLADEPKKLQEIGDEWGVSREAVRQMEARLMKKIKTHFEEMGEGIHHD